MIEDQDIIFKGRRYTWSCDFDRMSRADQWQWTDERGHVVPLILISTLNKEFIQKLAAGLAKGLKPSEEERFAQILKTMGATAEDLRRVGLGKYTDLLSYNETFGAGTRKSRPISKPPTPSQPIATKATAINTQADPFEGNTPDPAYGPLNNIVIRNWFFANYGEPFLLPSTVACLGFGPFKPHDLAEVLLRYKVTAQITWNIAPEVVILGRKGWTDEDIEHLDNVIDQRVGKRLKIYSQEMLLAFVATNRDPFHDTLALLNAFMAGHPGLELVSEGWKGWVTTYVQENWRTALAGRIDSGDWQEISPLKELGYRVGRYGLPTYKRQPILEMAFNGELPIVGPYSYMQQWGNPSSPARLKKMANSLAAHCTKMKRKKEQSQESIEAWETDLAWLRERFYHGHFTFEWPGDDGSTISLDEQE